MRPTLAWAVLAIGVGTALAQDGGGAPPAPPPRTESPKFGAAPEGLAIELKAIRSTFQPGEPIPIEVVLVNRSKVPLPVVVPDHGSEAGFREPAVSWAAWYVNADGAETPVEPKQVGRCGTGMSTDWLSSVVAVAAGGRVPFLKVERPTLTFDFQSAGTVRLRLRYAYGAGFHGSAVPGGGARAGTGAMGDQRPYRLDSEPVDVRIVRPLDVVVEVTGTARAGVATPVADLVRVKAVSRDGKRHALPADGWTLSYEYGEAGALALDCPESWPPRPLARSVDVPPGGEAVLQAAGRWTCKAAEAGACKVRAVLGSTSPDGGPRIVSAWTDLRFTK